MRKMAIIIAPALFLISPVAGDQRPSSVAGHHFAAHAEHLAGSYSNEDKKYACPPCGCNDDRKDFDKPGYCPACNMELVEKMPPVSTANLAESQTAVIRSAWVLEVPSSQSNTAAYLVLENNGPDQVSLVSAASDIAVAVELHTVDTGADSVMRMRKLQRIAVPAGGNVELKPGGLHLMLIGLNREIKAGDEVTVTLVFSDSTKKVVKMPVKKRD